MTANAAFNAITARIAVARGGPWVVAARSAATHRSSASGWVSWRTMAVQRVERRWRARAFGPYVDRRLADSEAVRPEPWEPIRSRTSSGLARRRSGAASPWSDGDAT